MALPDDDCKPVAASQSFVSESNHNLDDDTKGSVSNQDGGIKALESLTLLNTMIAVTSLYYEQGSAAGGDGKLALFNVQSDH